MLKVGKALCYLEDRDLVHRDIKPSNILIVGESDRIQPEIIDFGTCCEPHTMDGLLNQKSKTMNHSHSPETVFGGRIDIRHDFFCLGRLMYFIATDRLPYKLGHEPVKEMEYLKDNPPASTGDNLLDAVILPMLSINPDERLYGKDFVSEFSRYLDINTK